MDKFVADNLSLFEELLYLPWTVNPPRSSELFIDPLATEVRGSRLVPGIMGAFLTANHAATV